MPTSGQPGGWLDGRPLSFYADRVGKRIAVKNRTVEQDGLRRFGVRSGIFAAGFPFFLAGCMQQPPQAEAPPVRRTATQQNSSRGASVAFVGFDGGSEERTQRFATLFAESANAMEITTAPSAKAHYFLRGYLTATSMQDGGVRLAYVGDLFDRHKQRAQRLSGGITVPARGNDPWAAADDLKIRALATQGAQELADALADMPKAAAPFVARSSAPAGVTAVARQATGRPAPQPAMHANHTPE